MGRLPVRRALAFFCVVLVLFAVATSVDSQDHFSAVLPLLCLIFALVTVAVIRRGAPPCDERPAALLSLVLFRAPPAA